jgi:hypothetical protein
MQSRWNDLGGGGGGGCIRSQKIAGLSKAGKRKLVGPVSSQATVERYHTDEVRTRLPAIQN